MKLNKKALEKVCKGHKITLKTLENRMRLGLTLEQALNFKNKDSITLFGIVFDSVGDIAEQYHVNYDYIYGRNNLEDKILRATRINFDGNTYRSWAQLCEKYGMRYSTFRSRLYIGWDVERALKTEIAVKKGKEARDHVGNTFISFVSMCDYYSIPGEIVKKRLKLGWTLKEALETRYEAGKNTSNPSNKGLVVDHKGNKFYSIQDMAKHYKLPVYIVRERLSNGWDLKGTLETKVTSKTSAVTDHLGNTYRSMTEMSKAWGIPYHILNQRLSSKWEVERALTTKPNGIGRECTDHLGRKFKSIEEMASNWGINTNTLIFRLNNGWDIKEALTCKVVKGGRHKRCEDHLGNKFDSILDMAKYWGINVGTFRRRISYGWGLEKALTTPIK